MNRVALLLFCVVLYGAPAAAQVAPIAREAAEELIEWMLRQGGAHADDVARLGGETAAREAVEELARVAGREAAEGVVLRGGPGALRAVRELGDLAPEGARLVAAHGARGTLVVQQGGRGSVELFKRYGDEAVRLLADQGPEAGARLLNFAGDALSRHGRALSAEGQAHLRQFVPALETAEPAVRSAFLDKLAAGGDDFLLWVSRRWKPLAVAGGLTVAALTAYRVGDGVAEGVRGVVDAMPNPSRDAAAWFAWWLPVLALVALVVAGWVLRARFARRA